MSRTRAAAMGGIPPVNPVDIVMMVGAMGWACEADEAVHVLTGMDDAYRQMNSQQND